MTAPNEVTVLIAVKEDGHDRLTTAPVAILVASASLTPTHPAATTVLASAKTATLADVMTENGTVVTVLSEVNGANVEVNGVIAVAGTLTTDPVGTCLTTDEAVAEAVTVEIEEIAETAKEESEREAPHPRGERSLLPT